MDEKLQDLLEAKEGVDEAAPDADLNNKYTTKRKYIRTKHGDLEGKLFCFYNKLRITDSRASTSYFVQTMKLIPSSLEPLFVILLNMKLFQHQQI